MQLRVEDVEAITAAVRPLQERLCQAAARLSDDELREPSRLPGWTRGHVLTHLARNASGHVGMLGGLLRGDDVPQYPGGPEQRSGDIEAGAGRPAADIVRDVRDSAAELVGVWSQMTPPLWARGVQTLGGAKPAWRTAWSRWREVEIHWVDLDVGVTPRDWSAEFVQLALEEQAATLADRLPQGSSILVDDTQTGRSWRAGPPTDDPTYVVEGPSAELLAWLIGRLDDPAVLNAPRGLPALPDWA